jgi:hypothetical protein
MMSPGASPACHFRNFVRVQGAPLRARAAAATLQVAARRGDVRVSEEGAHVVFGRAGFQPRTELSAQVVKVQAADAGPMARRPPRHLDRLDLLADFVAEDEREIRQLFAVRSMPAHR